MKWARTLRLLGKVYAAAFRRGCGRSDPLLGVVGLDGARGRLGAEAIVRGHGHGRQGRVELVVGLMSIVDLFLLL